MLLKILLLGLIFVGILHVVMAEQTGTRSNNEAYYRWSKWSPCSTSCGYGTRSRTRTCLLPSLDCNGQSSQKKFCMKQFCPSYLTWPRLHFSGRLVADVSTVNNARCRYENKFFTPADLSKEMIGVGKHVVSAHTEYKFVNRNSNPDGSGHLYFYNTTITSICTGSGQCSTSDKIVKKPLRETTRATLVDLDPDWQFASEIWGLSLKIPGIFEAKYGVTSTQASKTRSTNDWTKGYLSGVMGRYKSKLTDIKWYDSHYKSLFKHATELSVTFVYDMYNQFSREGRITGTIGLTTEDDPTQTVATRVLNKAYWTGVGFAQFFFHENYKYITVDMSFAISSDKYGRFRAKKNLDLSMILTLKNYCKHFWNLRTCTSSYNPNQYTLYRLTSGGQISKQIHNDNKWYDLYGGVMDISLRDVDERALKLLQNNRLALTEQSLFSTYKIVLEEPILGVHTGLTGKVVHRLNPGDTTSATVFVSVFGRPGIGIPASVKALENVFANMDCSRVTCNRTLSFPSSALSFEPTDGLRLTNSCGLLEYKLIARDPGPVRGCGLDGQLYPLAITLRYSRRRKTINIMEAYTELAKAVPKTYHIITSLSMAVHVYHSVANIQCPSWLDVKEIFIQYYNLYPVMWKNDIIDMHSYKDIRKNIQMLKISMFDTDVENSRYMPITRDLSYDKKRLIWNWIKCGMKERSVPMENEEKDDKLSPDVIKNDLEALRRDLQAAINLELSTIPPYMTAWLSIKNEYGRNKEVSRILKSILTEEMLHMTLAANILNSIGGSVNLTTFYNIPDYPTPLGFGSFYNINQNTLIPLEPMSLGLVNDVFSVIEQPADVSQKQVLFHVGTIWNMLKSDLNVAPNVTETSPNMKLFLSEHNREWHDSYEKQEMNHKDSNISDKDYAMTNFWKRVNVFSSEKLLKSSSQSSHTVGGFYANLALKIADLESRVKFLKSRMKKSNYNKDRFPFLVGTIFTGDHRRQVYGSYWYHSTSMNDVEHVIEKVSKKMGEFEDHSKIKGDEDKRDSSIKDEHSQSSLFAVTDLASALRAIIEIVYQGEGGSDCSPFVSVNGEDSGELSHYYRFQEIVHGKKMIKIEKNKRTILEKCLNFSSSCPSSDKNWDYCYAGNDVSFYQDGVWPIVHNPKKEMYVKGSTVHKLNNQFNLVYTRLLFCLQLSLSGYPDQIKTCMTYMYDLTMIGRRLVSTPVGTVENRNSEKIGKKIFNGSPTWTFERDIDFREGLPLIT